jgi:hypothetical protein
MAVFCVTNAFNRFTVDPQMPSRIPPPWTGAAPSVTFRFRTVNDTAAVTLSTDPVAFPFKVAVAEPPWIVTGTPTVQLPVHGIGPNTVTVPPMLISACNPGVSVAAVPVHIYEPAANADPTPHANSPEVAATHTTSSCTSSIRGRRERCGFN